MVIFALKAGERMYKYLLLLRKKKKLDMLIGISCQCMLITLTWSVYVFPLAIFKLKFWTTLGFVLFNFIRMLGVLFLPSRSYVSTTTCFYLSMYSIISTFCGMLRDPLSVNHVFLWKVVDICRSLKILKSHSKILKSCIYGYNLQKIVGMNYSSLMIVRVESDLSLTLNFIGRLLIIKIS